MYYTLYKSLILQKGILIILFSIFAFAFINTNFKKDYNIQDIYYQYYINEVDGEITEQTDSYISAQERYFADLKIQMNDIMNNGNPFSSELTEIQKKLAPEMGFVLIKERYEQIKNLENAQLFYDTGYKRMFGKVGYDDDMKYALVTMLMCIFLISPLIANDNKYRMQSIINSTASGKKKYIRRNIIAATIFGLISAVIWLVGYSIKISQFYEFSGLDAPIQSITDFVNFPVSLKVWQYLALIYVLRTIAVIVSALIMLYISSKCKNTTMSVLVNFAVFVLPIIVYLLGADIMVNIGMNLFLSVNAVMNLIFK